MVLRLINPFLISASVGWLLIYFFSTNVKANLHLFPADWQEQLTDGYRKNGNRVLLLAMMALTLSVLGFLAQVSWVRWVCIAIMTVLILFLLVVLFATVDYGLHKLPKGMRLLLLHMVVPHLIILLTQGFNLWWMVRVYVAAGLW